MLEHLKNSSTRIERRKTFMKKIIEYRGLIIFLIILLTMMTCISNNVKKINAETNSQVSISEKR